MAIKKKDFQKLLNFVKEFQGKLPCNESSAELRDSLNLSLLHMHKYYKRVRIRYQNGGNGLDKSISLTSSLTGAASPVSPYIAPLDKFDWRWLNLDVKKLSASFGHGDKTNYIPEIFYVVKDCDLEKLKKMIQNDQDQVNELDAFGRTTAMYAIQGGTQQYMECLDILVTNGVDLQHQGNDGFSCLHIACYYGYKETIEVLLRAKVNVNVKDTDGRTPLHWAAAYCCSDVLELLIANGADASIQDNEGLTAAMWACHFDQLENLKVLLAFQNKLNPAPEASFEITDANGATILHWAVSRTSNIDCLKHLINAETVNLCDDEGRSIFLYAAEHGCLMGCEEILNVCSDDILEDVDNLGRSALHLATLGGHGEVVDLLLNKGAAQDCCDSQGATALDYAVNRKMNYCILVFISYQKYKERLQNMHAKLATPHENWQKPAEEQNRDKEPKIVAAVANSYENENKLLKHEDSGQVENSHLDDCEKSVKLDVQDAVGFEIDGDIEEDVEEDIEFEYQEDETDEKGERLNAADQNVKCLINDDLHKEIQKENVQANNEINVEEKTKSRGQEDDIKDKSTKILKNDEDMVKDTDVVNTDGKMNESTLVDSDIVNQEAKGNNEKDENNANISIEESSIDFEDEMIVLVAHHGSDDDMVIEYGNDPEKLDDSGKEQDLFQSEAVDANEATKLDPVGDRDLYETSRLSPRIESVTGLMETNTMPANYSASVNMSVSSLGSDSEEEANNGQGEPKKDLKAPPQLFEEHAVNQIEYRNPFPKQRLHRQSNTRANQLQPTEDDHPSTSHGKRKEKKGNKKEKRSPPRGKSEQAIPQNISRIGPLEPMKPLQPLIAPQGFSPNRNTFGNSTYLGSISPNLQDLALPPSSPRGNLDRSNGLSSPAESPRIPKSNQLPSPRFGFDGRDHTISHIPRPNSPRSREDHGSMGNLFPRPPIGR